MEGDAVMDTTKQMVHASMTMSTSTSTSTMHLHKTNHLQTIFLVPSVALAVQQQIFLQANLAETVLPTCASTVHSHNRTTLSQCCMLVAMHGAYLNLL